MSVNRSQRDNPPEDCSEGLCQAAIEDFAAYLHRRGYSAKTICGYVEIANRFRVWLRTSGKRRLAVRRSFISAFVERSRVKGHLRYVHRLQSGLGHLVQVLGNRGELMEVPMIPSAIDETINGFVIFMRDIRGLAESTITNHTHRIRCFLERKYGEGPLDLRGLVRGDLLNFLATYTKGQSRETVKAVASSLRTFLRHLQLEGICDQALVACIPTIPGWKLTGIPRVMTEKQLHLFLDSFDRSTAIGRRDYAMMLLMVTLGLRASEVAQLQLDDLNWRDASLRIVSPKTRGTNILPLPVKLGKAIADYLRHGRPSTSHRHVFARQIAPKDLPLNAGLIRRLVIRTFVRCGFARSQQKSSSTASNPHNPGLGINQLMLTSA